MLHLPCPTTAHDLHLEDTYFDDSFVFAPLADDSCLYPQRDQQPTVLSGSSTNSSINLTWSPAVLPSNCTAVVTSLAPLDYTVEYNPSGQAPLSVSHPIFVLHTYVRVHASVGVFKKVVGIEAKLQSQCTWLVAARSLSIKHIRTYVHMYLHQMYVITLLM